VVSYTLAMETCLRGGQWNTSLEVLNEMTMRGVRLDSKACLTAIDVSLSDRRMSLSELYIWGTSQC
jgi:pentatricopeptide repeat protein